MTKEELIKQFHQLPGHQKKAFIEEILSAPSEDAHETAKAETADGAREEKVANLNRIEGLATGKPNSMEPENGHGSLSRNLYGILEFESGPPTDEEVKEIIADYLLKKYY